MDPAGRYRIVMTLEAPYLLGFRHKKRRPWTSLDVVLVEPGGFEPYIQNGRIWSMLANIRKFKGL